MTLAKTVGQRSEGGKRAAPNAPAARSGTPPISSRARALTTLCIDIGGTGIKMIALDSRGKPANERARMLTPHPARPAAVVGVIRRMLPSQPAFDRVSVGFPGVVVDGVVKTAVNLGTDFWHGHDFERDLTRVCGVPARVINDADLQGYGVVQGRGVELVLTLGTGLGSALFVDGHLVPNLELGHHPLKKGKTYEERVCDAELKRLGKREWGKRVLEALQQIDPIFNPRLIHLGGGNAEHLKLELPRHVRKFANVDGMTGGFKLWGSP